jgi:hypothetical protein
MPEDDVYIHDDDDGTPVSPNDLDFEEDDEFFPENFDLEEVLDKSIFPLLKSIMTICSEYDIPMVASFQYGKDTHKVMLSTSVVSPPNRTCVKIINAANMLLS